MTREEAIDFLKEEKFKNVNSKYRRDWNDASDMAIEALQAEPVKHGEWKVYEMHTTQYGEVGFECSVCGVPYRLKHRLGADVGWHYCPNCGAKMDKEKEDGIKRD